MSFLNKILDPPPKTIGLLLECLFKKLIISSSFLAILKSFETTSNPNVLNCFKDFETFNFISI